MAIICNAPIKYYYLFFFSAAFRYEIGKSGVYLIKCHLVWLDVNYCRCRRCRRCGHTAAGVDSTGNSAGGARAGRVQWPAFIYYWIIVRAPNMPINGNLLSDSQALVLRNETKEKKKIDDIEP